MRDRKQISVASGESGGNGEGLLSRVVFFWGDKNILDPDEVLDCAML